MLHSLRQVLVLLACAAVLCAIVGQLNHYAAPWAVTFSVPGLLVVFAALRLPLGPGFASAFVAGLCLDASDPVPFGSQALLLGLAFCLVHRLRARLPREQVLVGVVAALFVNLALFVLLAFIGIGGLPDPASGGLRILADLLVSQILTALIGPWFLAFEAACLRLAGAAPLQVVNRYA
jgi:rod shape-determining protein MreD